VTASQVLLLVALLVSVPFAADAEPRAVPGGSSGMVTGGVDRGSPHARSPACRSLSDLRKQLQKRADDMGKASDPLEKCQVFRSFLATETKLVSWLEQHGGSCGTPSDALNRIKEGIPSTVRFVDKICEAAPLVYPSDLLSPPEVLPQGDFWRPGEFEHLQGSPGLQ
jgi:hypothetical protein